MEQEVQQEVKVVVKQTQPTPSQTSNHLLMIEPVAFGFNAQTAKNNYFQSKTSGAQPKALAEFHALVDMLRAHGVNVLVFKDNLLPHHPDAIFPNNAVTFHDNGKAFLYPLFAPNRRKEISHDMLHRVKAKGFVLKEIYDMCPVADSKQFLEGTGSMVFDRVNRIAYACHSPRTNEKWLKKTCKRLNYKPILFSAKQNVTWKRLPICHTNMMMTLGEDFVIICLDAIEKKEDKALLLGQFARTGKEIILITERQMCQFAANSLQVRTPRLEKKRALIMSTGAYESLDSEQIASIESHCPILHSDISTIEENGGGGVRSMMAEIFLPRRARVITVTVSPT